MIGEDEGGAPWALQMSRDCRKFGQFPRSGDWFSQDDYEMTAMRVAETSEAVYIKQMHNIKWDLKDGEFSAWVETDDSDN